MPPFGQVRADSAHLVPGAVYNLALLTVRNGTSQIFDSRSGFSVSVAGSSGSQAFPQGPNPWKPGDVLVFYVLTKNRFAPNFTFDFQGNKSEKPSNIYYNIQYNPTTFPGFLNSLVSTRVVGGRYRLS